MTTEQSKAGNWGELNQVKSLPSHFIIAEEIKSIFKVTYIIIVNIDIEQTKCNSPMWRL